MDPDSVSHLHDKMGLKRRGVRRRQGTESKRVANAMYAITSARTNDGSDQESLTTSPTVTNSASGSPTSNKIEDYSCSSESGDEEGTLYEDVYVDEIDESEDDEEKLYETDYEDAEEFDEEVLVEEEDEKEVSETEVNDETEFEFDEQVEVGVGSISIDETETETGWDVVEVVVSREKVEKWAVEEVLEEEYEEDVIDETGTPAKGGTKALGDTAVPVADTEANLNDSCDRADVLEAISYILKQERVVRKEILTQDQVQDMMNLPLAELLEVLEHFEVSDSSKSPIRWDLVIEKIEANQGTEDFDAYQGIEDEDKKEIDKNEEEIVKSTDEKEIVEDTDEVEIVEDTDEVEIVEDTDEVEIFEEDGEEDIVDENDEVEIFEDDEEVEIFEDDVEHDTIVEEDEEDIIEEEDEVEIIEEEDEVEIFEEEDEIEIFEEEDEIEIIEAKDGDDQKSSEESEDKSDEDDESSDSSDDHQDFSLEAISAGCVSSINNDFSEVSEGELAKVDEVVFSIDEPKLREMISVGTSEGPAGGGGTKDQIRKKGSRGKPRNDFFI